MFRMYADGEKKQMESTIMNWNVLFKNCLSAVVKLTLSSWQQITTVWVLCLHAASPASRSRAAGDWELSAAPWVEQQTSHCYLGFLLHSAWKEKGQQSIQVYNKLMVTSSMLHQIKKINKPIYISKTIQSAMTVQSADKELMFFSSRSLAEVKFFLDVTQSHYNILFKSCSVKNALLVPLQFPVDCSSGIFKNQTISAGTSWHLCWYPHGGVSGHWHEASWASQYTSRSFGGAWPESASGLSPLLQ